MRRPWPVPPKKTPTKRTRIFAAPQGFFHGEAHCAAAAVLRRGSDHRVLHPWPNLFKSYDFTLSYKPCFPLYRVSIVAEHFARLLQHCGMPATDVDYIHGDSNPPPTITL